MANKGSRAATSRLDNSGGQISPSYVELKSPSGGGEIQPIADEEKKTNEYEAASELLYARENQAIRDGKSVNTRVGAGRFRCLTFSWIYSY